MFMLRAAAWLVPLLAEMFADGMDEADAAAADHAGHTSMDERGGRHG